MERQLAKRTTLAVTYYGSVGEHLFLSRDINAPSLRSTAPTVVPDPAFGVIREIESSGRQVGNSLEVTLRGQMTRHVTGLIQYTLSRTDNDTGGVNWLPANQYDSVRRMVPRRFRPAAPLQHAGKFQSREIIYAGRRRDPGHRTSLTRSPPGTDDFDTGLNNARPAGVPRNSLQGPGYADFDFRLSRDFFLNQEKKDKGMIATVGLRRLQRPQPCSTTSPTSAT